MQFILTDDQVKAIVSAYALALDPAGAGGILLFTDDLTPTKNTVLADLTEATFTGYAIKATNAGAVYRRADGSWSFTLADCVWVCTAAPGAPETIYGWAAVDVLALPTAILAAGRLTTPVTIVDAGDGIVLSAIVGLNQTGGETLEMEVSAEQGS